MKKKMPKHNVQSLADRVSWKQDIVRGTGLGKTDYPGLPLACQKVTTESMATLHLQVDMGNEREQIMITLHFI